MKVGLAVLLIAMVTACGGNAGRSAQSPVAAVSPAATSVATASPTASASAAPSLSPSPRPSPTPLATPTGTLLVIDDFNSSQVRLARLDAFDTAVAIGHYDAVVNGQVIVVNGTALEALSRSGAVRKLGVLAGGTGAVAVKPDLSQWVYTIADNSWTSRIHLGSAAGDRVVATIPSPDGNAFYQAFAWNASGVYFVRQATGLGGVGPFLEYVFPLAKFDLATGRMTDVSPVCYAYAVLAEGTMVCRGVYNDPHLQVRTQSGLTYSIQITTGTNTAFARVHVSADNSRVIVSRNGATDPKVNYQMAVAGLTSSTASAFGPLDYIPDTWLPDGRLVADHWCWPSDIGGGPCNTALDGTYIFSADGSTRTFFYKLKAGQVVNYI
jgi:hypothetical protein